MKKILIFVLGFSLLALSGCALKSNRLALKTRPNQNQEAQNTGSASGKNSTADNRLADEQKNQPRLVAKDYFTLEAPANWLEGSSLPGVSLMMVNSTEEITNPDAKKINFHSYFSVSYDKLGDKDEDQYLAGLKSNLAQAVPDIVFTKENSLTIGGREAKALEADLSQQGVDFKLLMFLIRGQDQDVWIVSFNTLKDSGSGYQDLFYQIAGSFRIKQ